MEHKRPPMQREITWTDLGDRIYNISTPPVGFQQYLIVGNEKAMMIDTGLGIGSIRQTVDAITSLPLILVNTHCHPDHAGGNAEFPPALINPADFDVFEKMTTLEFRQQDVSHMPGGEEWVPLLQPTGPKPISAEDGQIIDLGGRQLKLIFTPGHTPGSTCFFEMDGRPWGYSGDAFGSTNLLLMTNFSTLIATTTRIERYLRLHGIEKMYPGHYHGDNPETPQRVRDLRRMSEEMLDGRRKGEPTGAATGLNARINDFGVNINYRDPEGLK